MYTYTYIYIRYRTCFHTLYDENLNTKTLWKAR